MNFLAAAAYQESRFAQFTDIQQCSPSPLIPLTDGYPVQACDNGYGIMQLTQGVPGGLTYNLGNYTDTPTQDMIWNWVANINAGENVMLDKLKGETTYEDRFTQDTGFYYPTPEQQEMNVWQRYNGGLYWVWRCADSQGNISLYTDPESPCLSAPACNPNDDPNSAYFCQWIKNQLPTTRCSDGTSRPYAECVEAISNNNPSWCK